MARAANKLPASYPMLLEDIKSRIHTAQVKAALSVNRELTELYWNIGNEVLKRQRQEGWGAKVIDRLSIDLKREFPQIKGFSTRNLKYMRKFAEVYPEFKFVQQVAAQIPWFHNCTIIDKVKDHAHREWYILSTLEHGWSRNVLVHQIESDLYGRQGKAITNFAKTLPTPQSELANQLLKDPYHLDFLSIGPDVTERRLEMALLDRLKNFLMELGKGFAFVGNQVHWSDSV
jgi:predicted nuclease of restriction endonuclease-like (RecB) superfamily